MLYNPLSAVIIRIWQMDTFQMSGGRTPLGDVTNTMRDSQAMSQLVDAKERKRANERARYASMSLDQRNEKNKKRRESRQRKKGDPSNHF
jgi:hypothetical protein